MNTKETFVIGSHLNHCLFCASKATVARMNKKLMSSGQTKMDQLIQLTKIFSRLRLSERQATKFIPI